MPQQFPINDPDLVWAEMERLSGVDNMSNGERHLFEATFRNLLHAGYTSNPITRQRFYRAVAFQLYDLVQDPS